MRLLFEDSSGLDTQGLSAPNNEKMCTTLIAVHKSQHKVPTAKDLKSARKEAHNAYRQHISKSTKPLEKAHSTPTISEVVE